MSTYMSKPRCSLSRGLEFLGELLNVANFYFDLSSYSLTLDRIKLCFSLIL